MSSIEISYRNTHSLHGKEIVHARDPYFRPNKALTWPDTRATITGMRERQPFMIKVDGLVVGRAYLETELYPFAEIQNLILLPEFRGKGLGGAIVDDLVKRAAELGYLAIHLQTDIENRAAQRLYQHCGFVPAQIGARMLRMVRFLHFHLLDAFHAEFPLLQFSSAPNEPGECAGRTLRWCDPISTASLTLGLTGGSCQADSAGCGPGLTRLEYRREDTHLRGEIRCRPGNARNHEMLLQLRLSNHGATAHSGHCRLLLNHGYQPVTEADGAVSYQLAPGEITRMDFPLRQTAAFHREYLQYSYNRSIPFGVEVFSAEKAFWLATQLMP